ncbi:6-phosphofructo-2-kinase/fructose-2,6-bisphosphatase 2 [Fragariocoptes setiger]|uniref:6-phosphofructo-2-kinase/fructose-2, 6-bisphosphatase 2 n=1 Tax=Fragariocoptes setiger TaxID=1670756 RepID=A0ABQ7S5K4_9ACAR|nr:6-phosphofructo-2-kinase/fructose-2,6-bisphosphatase 2 [Fragariocoptes setiger]
MCSATVTRIHSSSDSALGPKEDYIQRPCVLALVGLPARGKSFISKKLAIYLNWIGHNTRIFNVGEYRRVATDAYKARHDFFSLDNHEAQQIRENCAKDALEDMCQWLRDGDGHIGIYDATNTTRERRHLIYQTVVEEYGFELIFIESICDESTILEANIQLKTKSPDYKHMDDKQAAIEDFKLRIEHYKSRYEPLEVDTEEKKYSFIKIFNAGERLYLHQCDGQVHSLIISYLCSLYAPSN